MIDEEWLKESFGRIRKAAALGVDQMSASKYAENLDNNLNRLLNQLKTNAYQAQPVRRTYIPKGDG